MQGAAEALRARVSELENQLAAVQAQLAESREENAKLRAEAIEDAGRRAASASTEADGLAKRANEARELFEMRAGEMESLRQRLDVSRKERASAESTREAAWSKLSAAVEALVGALPHAPGSAELAEDNDGWGDDDW